MFPQQKYASKSKNLHSYFTYGTYFIYAYFESSISLISIMQRVAQLQIINSNYSKHYSKIKSN